MALGPLVRAHENVALVLGVAHEASGSRASRPEKCGLSFLENASKNLRMSAPLAVPEPSTSMLLLVGLAWVARVFRASRALPGSTDA